MRQEFQPYHTKTMRTKRCKSPDNQLSEQQPRYDGIHYAQPPPSTPAIRTNKRRNKSWFKTIIVLIIVSCFIMKLLEVKVQHGGLLPLDFGQFEIHQHNEKALYDATLEVLNTTCDAFTLSNHNVERTVSCPCGSQTSTNYRSKMAKIYSSGSHDLSTLKRCFQLTLPLKPTDPIECWPSIIILPSHPTNGSGLARLLLQHAIGLNAFLDQYGHTAQKKRRGVTKFYDFYNLFQVNNNHNNHKNPKKRLPEKQMFSISSSCKTNETSLKESFPIPLMNHPAIFKSHLGITKEDFKLKFGGKLFGGGVTDTSHVTERVKGADGVIRLARNPGDQILRNSIRWGNQETYNQDKDVKEEWFNENAHKVCKNIFSSTYLRFHSNWNSIDDDAIPQITYHYEHFSDPTHVMKATEKVMRFLNVAVQHDDIIGDKLADLIDEPTYTHGTLMSKICGKEDARKLHAATRNVTEKLGYVFDYEAATWSLPDLL